jgi:AcrR family transcriptional regulator
MSPEDRRDAIVVATIPLLRERGADVTTRELADAAGVAEGTLFRVFPDKVALVRAAVLRALDPQSALDQLAGVEAALPLRVKIRKVVAVLAVHVDSVSSLLAIGHELSAVQPGDHPHPAKHHPPHGHHPVENLMRGVAEVLDPHQSELRFAPAVCARMLVGLVLTSSRPLSLGAAPSLTPDLITALFCDGALAPTPSVEDPC